MLNQGSVVNPKFSFSYFCVAEISQHQGITLLSYKSNVTLRSIPFAVIKNVYSLEISGEEFSYVCYPARQFTVSMQTFTGSLERCSQSSPLARLSPPRKSTLAQAALPWFPCSPRSQHCPSPSPSFLHTIFCSSCSLWPSKQSWEYTLTSPLQVVQHLGLGASFLLDPPSLTHIHIHTVILLYSTELLLSQVFMREEAALCCTVLFLLPSLLPGALCNCDAFVTTSAPSQYKQHPHMAIY